MSQTYTLRDIIRNFTPNWFTVTMGTGILALAIGRLCPTGVLHAIAQGLWFFNIGLFVLFTLLYTTRWILFPKEAKRIFSHSVAPMFFGAIPMGLATIINGFLAFGIALWGNTAVTIAKSLWWIDMSLSISIGVLIPFFMLTRQDHSIEKMTAVWLLPVVAAEVAAASAGLLVPHLSNGHQEIIFILGYVLWGISVPIAMSILVILFIRLTLHKLPHKDMAASMLLSLGPVGTGALGLLLLGADATTAFPSIGNVASSVGIIGGAIIWGYGVWWLLLTLLTTARYIKEGMPFNLGWWGFTFPLGVYAVATIVLGEQTKLAFITNIGVGLVIALALFWCIIMTRTIIGTCCCTLFVDPSLAKGSIPND